MADNTKIEWTDATWNPITGCSVVSAGCRHCYAMKLAGTRLQHHPSRAGLTIDTKEGPVWNGKVRFNEQWLRQPLQWLRPRRIFVCAHGDLFHELAPDEWIDRVFAVMADCPQHTFQILTKRPARMLAYLSNSERVCRAIAGWHKGNLRSYFPADHLVWQKYPLPNVWIGVSVEDQAAADERIPLLLKTPAAVHWISAEPLLGPVDLDSGAADGLHALGCGHAGCDCGNHGIDWVVVGGESGAKARPMHPDWARSLRDQCAAAGVPFLFKQWGEWTPGVNVDRQRGTVDTAILWDDCWHINPLNLATDNGHIDDEPDLYRVGKKAAGRRLDGKLHDGYPEAQP